MGDLCEESALSPELVVLEIPELQLTSSHHDALTCLKTQGFAVVVDEFGTGYSSLSMLRQLPLVGRRLTVPLLQRSVPTDQPLKPVAV